MLVLKGLTTAIVLAAITGCAPPPTPRLDIFLEGGEVSAIENKAW
jgi:hypothetical protein